MARWAIVGGGPEYLVVGKREVRPILTALWPYEPDAVRVLADDVEQRGTISPDSAWALGCLDVELERQEGMLGRIRRWVTRQ